ncbi:MAG TPA: class I SAM-dependent methyltransferase, partial [Candidatus Binatia bacterium]|nr:class I SAM-dependent methyltransferase [Candidatus Binatia bacterium]
GALIDSILAVCDPKAVLAIDQSEGFIAEAQHRIGDSRVRFEVGDTTALPWSSGSCDVTVSGLVLNFVSDAGSMAKEMARMTQPGGRIAVYVWDYAHGMQMMQHFWDAAVELNPDDSTLDEAKRFPLWTSPLSSETSMIIGCRFSASRAPHPLTLRHYMMKCAIEYATH